MVILPKVAGKFYPENPAVLRHDVSGMLENAADKAGLPIPKAIIAPHAGYIYSGPIAAAAYACLSKRDCCQPNFHTANFLGCHVASTPHNNGKEIQIATAPKTQQIERVVILAPAHQYPVEGIAVTAAKSYLTPLGGIPIDQKSIADLDFPYLNIIEAAFTYEHAVEVHLPFLQLTLGSFSLVPLLIGSVTVFDVERVLEKLWDGSETLVIISSDLSHYHPYNLAQTLDQETAAAILNLDPDGFSFDQACGATAIKALLGVAVRKNMAVTQIDLRNSGDTAGSKESVVGYGAFHFAE